MRGWRRSTACALALVGLAALAPAEAAAAKTTSLAVFGDRDDYVLQGYPEIDTPKTHRFAIQGDARSVTVSVRTPDDTHYRSLTFAAPPGKKLARGVYVRAQRAPFHEQGRGGMDVDADSRGCNELLGDFQIKDIGFDARGHVRRLWVVFDQHCEIREPALAGELRINEPRSDGMRVSPSIARWPAIDPGRPTAPADVALTADRDLRVARASVVGDGAKSFKVARDRCSGKSLARGHSCRVRVRFVPTGRGTRSAKLRFADSKGRRRDAKLEGYVYGGRTRIVVHSDPGDPVGEGGDWSYTTHDAYFGESQSPRGAAIGAGPPALWGATFLPPDEGRLRVGHYAAKRFPPDKNHASMEISHEGNYPCDDASLTGEFDVKEVSYYPRGPVRALSVTFEQHCGGAAGGLHGTLEYRAANKTPPAPWLSKR